MPAESFESFFQRATKSDARPAGVDPYPYQIKLALAPATSRLIHIPTGCGKTAAAILAWLWRRRVDPGHTPRRLVYCLPMRVLVEQTCHNAAMWLENLGLQDRVGLHILMGGEEADDWDLYPERDAILVGTQDMLLSRALNRGYAMSRYRWPMHFGLLHTDCLWVFDEIQLMGSGLATTAQLEGFRDKLGRNGCHAFWMSATLQRDWLRTVDFDPADLPLTELESDDLATDPVRAIREARKPLWAANARMGDAADLAKEIVNAHEQARGLTLVVVNTVKRARELHEEIKKLLGRDGVPTILIHSRFRPPDRKKQIDDLLATPGAQGTIVISTQVVEAGVDVSARTLFTELVPWPSLVQRFGRCNRRGADNDTARAFWIDLPDNEKEQKKVRYPYELEELTRSRDFLLPCKDVSPASLKPVPFTQPFQHKWVIRRKDFIELFDTTPDLGGNDIDIDRYVRETHESDVRVFWRKWPADEPPPADTPGPHRDELCPVPICEFRKFVKDGERRKLAYRWDYLDQEWAPADGKPVYPGQLYLLHPDAGGYAPDTGWDVELKKKRVDAIEPPDDALALDAYDGDALSQRDYWASIAEHTDDVYSQLEAILSVLPLPESQILRLSARWHDWGKAHDVFQDAIDDGQTVIKRGKSIQYRERPAERRGSRILAKAPGKVWRGKKLVDAGFWRRYGRRHFRHELASALAVLQRPHDGLAPLSNDDLAFVAYLVAAHHGKVRLSIRSLPGEKMPPNNERFARGVWDGDELPAIALGGGVNAPAARLSLEPMELGLCEQPPFRAQPSWAERMLRLRDKLGPCRLAYLEAILRAADMRASKDAHSKEKPGA